LQDDWFLPRVLELTYTAWDLEPFAQDCGWSGPPFCWDEERRFLLRCELDAAFFHLYLQADTNGNWCPAAGETAEDLVRFKASFPTPRYAVAYIMDTFPIVKRKDEAQWGTYRTKETILKIYDAMAQVIMDNAAAEAAGQEPTARYESSLSPPPGPPTDAAGNFISVVQLDPAQRPSHIHPSTKEPIEKPDEVPLELFAAAYPASDTDKAICAAALAIVEQSQSISSPDHLECLLLVTHPDSCKIFLDQSEYRVLGRAKNSAPNSLFKVENQSIRWRECRDHLEQKLAIAVRRNEKGQPITPGANLVSVKNDLPKGVDEIVRFALKTLGSIAELRKDLSAATQEQAEFIQGLEPFHKQYQLAG
jgi:hypothetical protein